MRALKKAAMDDWAMDVAWNELSMERAHDALSSLNAAIVVDDAPKYEYDVSAVVAVSIDVEGYKGGEPVKDSSSVAVLKRPKTVKVPERPFNACSSDAWSVRRLGGYIRLRPTTVNPYHSGLLA